MRLNVVRVTIIVAYILVMGYTFYLQVIQGNEFFRLSKNNRIRLVPTEGWRGRIYDRNGFVLAENRQSFDVTVIPQMIQDQEFLFTFLSEKLDISKSKLLNKYRQKRFTPFAPVPVAEDVTYEEAMRIEEESYRFPSILVQKRFRRHYPYGSALSHVLGYIGKIDRTRLEQLKTYGYKPESIVGYTGIEEMYDDHLQGEDGGMQIEVNSRGQQVRLLGMKRPLQGNDIKLTIDKDMQVEAMNLMDNRVGSIIVMDQETGEILTMVSSPSFDPYYFIDRKKSIPLTPFQEQNAPFLNRSIKGVYPPGSIFKIPVAIAGLDQKKIKLYETINCKGHVEVGGTRFGCTHVRGAQNAIEAIAHSCNVYFYLLGLRLGEQLIYQYANSFGLGQITGLDLPYEEDGYLPNRFKRVKKGGRWHAGDTVNYSIGQGEVLATPLQLVRMMATVANNGTMVQPYLLKSVGDKEVITPEAYHVSLNDNTIYRSVKKGLRGAVQRFSGTAHVLDLPGLSISGKTGTAQSVPGKDHHSWFVGYTEGQDRNLAFCVFLEHGGSSYNACLLAKNYLLRLKERKRI